MKNTELKSMVEMLNLLYHYSIGKRKEWTPGMCGLCSILLKHKLLTGSEELRLLSFIYRNRPVEGEYLFDDYYGRFSTYFWEPNDWVTRRKWMKYHIERLNKKKNETKKNN